MMHDNHRAASVAINRKQPMQQLALSGSPFVARNGAWEVHGSLCDRKFFRQFPKVSSGRKGLSHSQIKYFIIIKHGPHLFEKSTRRAKVYGLFSFNCAFRLAGQSHVLAAD